MFQTVPEPLHDRIIPAGTHVSHAAPEPVTPQQRLEALTGILGSPLVHCPRCDSDEVYRHGLSPTKRERFRCQCCCRVFQLDRQEGRNEGKLEVARTMLQNGIDRNTTMKMTSLTEDDLAQIRH